MTHLPGEEMFRQQTARRYRRFRGMARRCHRYPDGRRCRRGLRVVDRLMILQQAGRVGIDIQSGLWLGA